MEFLIKAILFCHEKNPEKLAVSAWIFLTTIWMLHFSSLSKEQPRSPNANHCVLTYSTRDNQEPSGVWNGNLPIRINLQCKSVEVPQPISYFKINVPFSVAASFLKMFSTHRINSMKNTVVLQDLTTSRIHPLKFL